MKEAPDEIAKLSRQIAGLRAELAKLNNHRFMRIQNSPWRLMTQRLMMGLMVGLGSVLGATFLVSVLVYILTQIDFLPFIGEWAKTIVTDIQASHPTSELPIGNSGAAPPAPTEGAGPSEP